MENAARAFVIAGGVLLSMAIIGIAVSVYSNASGFATEADKAMSSTQISSFNRFYTSYDTVDGRIRCIDAINVLNRAIEDDIEDINNTEGLISFDSAKGCYYADSKSYLQYVSYEIDYVPGVGIVQGVEITR